MSKKPFHINLASQYESPRKKFLKIILIPPLKKKEEKIFASFFKILTNSSLLFFLIHTAILALKFESWKQNKQKNF